MHSLNTLPRVLADHSELSVQQLPPIVRLRLLKKLDYDRGPQEFLLNISATVEGDFAQMFHMRLFVGRRQTADDQLDQAEHRRHRCRRFATDIHTRRISNIARSGNI